MSQYRGEILGSEVVIDLERTKGWYSQSEEWPCTCGHCCNFLALAKQRLLLPSMMELLDKFSIVPEKATYVCELYHEENWREKGLLYELSWRVAGTILDRPAGKDNGPDWGPLVKLPWGSMILGHETFPVEPEFPQPHFDMDFTLYLPWVLDEPIDGRKEGEP